MNDITTDNLTPISPRRRRLATAILVLAALGAVVSFVVTALSIRSADPETLVVESWQLFGFLVFAGIFLLLAYRPNQYPGIWELVIFHKAAIAVFLFGVGSDTVSAMSVVIIDGMLAIALIGAYLLVRGYRNWNQLRRVTSRSNV